MMAFWFGGAVIITGELQWAKGLYDAIKAKSARSIVLAVALVVAAFCAALASKQDLLWTWQGIWAVGQIGYETIIKSIQERIKKV